jgi:hypothetical protein
MDVVIRTSHGEGEVTVSRFGAVTTVADLVATVSGRAAPPVVDIDGRAVPSSTRLHDAALLTGSVVDVDPGPPDIVARPGAAPAQFEIVQIAGPGTGATSRLHPGTYRIGPGRRNHAPELEVAAVERPVVHIAVGASDVTGPRDVTVTLVDEAVRVRAHVDGQELSPGRPAPWREGVLDVADRAFELRPIASSSRPLPDDVRAGTVAFERSPASTIWAGRADGADAVRLVVGIQAGPPGPPGDVTVDLATERGIGLVGSAEFTRAAARSLIVDAARRLGPADVDVVIVTGAGRGPTWEWAKWLPHTRIDGPPGPYVTDEQIATWVAGVSAPGRERPWGTRPHLTLVVADDPERWRGRSAALRPLLSEASLPLRWIVLATDVEELPAVCATIVTERPADGAGLTAAHGSDRIERFLPSLLTASAALAEARRLAPLDDQDLPATVTGAAAAPARLVDLLGIEPPTLAAVTRRRDLERGAPRTVIGVAADGPVRFDLAEDGPNVVIAGTSDAGAADLVQTLVFGVAVACDPPRVVFVFVDVGDGDVFGPSRFLPHEAGTVLGLDAWSADRLLRSLRAELSRRRSPDAGTTAELPRLVVVAHGLSGPPEPVLGLVDQLLEIARLGAGLGIHLVLVDDPPEDEAVGVVEPRVAEAAGIRIALRLHDRADARVLVGGDGPLRLPRHQPGAAIVQVHDDPPIPFRAATTRHVPAGDALELRPFVVARDLNPMERRTALHAAGPASSGHPDAPTGGPTDADALLSALAQRAGRVPVRRVVPPPLPDAVTIDDLLRDHPGDAVPVALVDLPDEQRHAVRWWEPHVAGVTVLRATKPSAAAEATSSVAALVYGVANRTSPDDVEVYLVGSGGGPLGALRGLVHVRAFVEADDDAARAALATELRQVIGRRRRTGPGGTNLMVVLDGEAAVRELGPLVLDPAAGVSGIVTLGPDGREPWDADHVDRSAITRWDVFPVDASGRIHGRATDGQGHEARLARPPADLPAALGASTAEATT